MPIRFHCQRCRQLLGIASRKAGSEIECPKCGWSQVVPSHEAASAAMAMDQFAKDHDAVENVSDLTVYDDQPAAIETPLPERAPSGATETPPAATPGLPAETAPQEGLRPVPRGMILYPRRTLYVQALLLLVLFAVGFGSGYLIGRGGAPERQGDGQAAGERILIEGSLVYDPGTGRLAGDQDAVIIAVPQRATLKTKIPLEGIRPGAAPTESQKGVRMIRQLGGEYARADASGAFSMVVPRGGDYYVLVISSRARRPEGNDIDEADLVEMERYFSRPDLLIGRQKYLWRRWRIDAHVRIDHSFGRDRQDDAQR